MAMVVSCEALKSIPTTQGSAIGEVSKGEIYDILPDRIHWQIYVIRTSVW